MKKLMLALVLGLILIVAGCNNSGLLPTPDNNTGIASTTPTTAPSPTADNLSSVVNNNSGSSFRSDKYYLTVELPPNWAAAEGPAHLAKPFEGQVAFNSWNQSDFWAKEAQVGNSFSYSRQTVGSQVPDGGAYVVLVRIQGPAPVPPYDTPEYTANDLGGLWMPHDARQDGGKFIDFYKWGRNLRLDVYCSADASDKTLADLNALLKSWRFDEIPAGDPEWAEGQARRLLPESVGPLWFPIRPAFANSGNVSRTTEVELRGKTVHFRFIYSWDGVRLPAPVPDGYRFTSSHWWEIDMLPTGEAVETAEGGASLPAS